MNVPSGYTALDLVGFTDKGVYNSATNYVQNDLAHYGGNIWRCKADDTQGITPAEGAAWTLWIGEPTNLTEAIIAPLEVSPATAAHTVGDQLIYNDVLYKVIGAIAIGDTLTVGTNIEAARKIVYQISGIESDIATIEPTATASQNYAVGEYMFYGWEFYKVITAITAGDTIVTTGGSANVTEVTVGGELNSLNTSLAQKTPKSDIAIIESGTTASANRVIGDFVYVSGTLYKVTAAISAGAAYTVGTNIKAETVGNALSSVEDVSSSFTKVLTDVTLYAYRYGRIIEVIANGGGNVVPASGKVKIATFTDDVKPIRISATEVYGSNAAHPRGIRIESDGVYLMNNETSSQAYIQGRVMYIA